jgi:tetratricopeptide (TPR) repeat protein
MINDRRGEASTLDLVAMAYGLIGDVAQSLLHFERAISLLRQLDDRMILSSALASAAHFSSGSWSTATYGVQELPTALKAHFDEPAEEAIRLAREIGWRSGEAYAACQSGATLLWHGNLRRGFQRVSDGLSIAERIQHRQWQTLAHMLRGCVYVDLLLPAHARRSLEQGLNDATATGSSIFRTSAMGLLATALLQAGDDVAAEQLLQGEIDLSRGPRLFSEGTCWYAQASLLLVRMQPEQALQAVDLVIASIPVGTAAVPPEWLRLRGEILLACDRLDEAETSLNDARTVASTHGLALIHWRVLASLQRLYLRTGRSDEATTTHSAALAIVNDLAAQFDDSEVRDMFLANAHAQLDRPLPPATIDDPA